jgi:hypothetical protein
MESTTQAGAPMCNLIYLKCTLRCGALCNVPILESGYNSWGSYLAAPYLHIERVQSVSSLS